jgi:hypothetical protein
MIPKELADQVRSEVTRLKQVQDEFLQTYYHMCVAYGPKWQKHFGEVVSHQIRKEIIPIMEEAGMDHRTVQALCHWAENAVMKLEAQKA